MKSSAAVPVPGAEATAIVVASLEGWSRLAVTVLDPPSSVIEAGASTSVTVGATSLSASVTEAVPTVRPVAVVDPLTVSVSSGSSISSFSGASVKVPVWLVAPEAIVIVKSLTATKSVTAVAVFPATETVTGTVVARAAPFSIAVTVTVRAAPVAPSETLDGDTDNSTVVESASSSLIASVCAVGCTIPRPFDAEPLTVTLLAAVSSNSLSTPVIVTVPVLVVASAAMVSVLFDVTEKSAAAVLDPAVAVSVIVVAWLDGWSSVAVTVLVPRFSDIELWDSTSVTVGGSSLSVIVTVLPPDG